MNGVKRKSFKSNNKFQSRSGSSENQNHGGSKGKKESDNPFDKFANAKKKHDVLNRRVKGEDRNVGKARAKSVEDRKSRLLQDYQANKKGNTFADKRFGEQDANLSLEDKMFMRFQKENMKKARNSTIFNLDNNEPEVLTHKGKVLGDANINDNDWNSDDEDGGLGKDVVESLHFGGGLVPSRKSNSEVDNEQPKKNRLDALQEIVMKSKLGKLQKKEAKEEQEDEREKLDKVFDSLVADAELDFRPVKRGRDNDGNDDQNGEFSEYDKSLAAMAFEAKARPTDRTKTDEEIAVEGRQRLEALEQARQRRMKANLANSNSNDNNDEEAEAEKALLGRKKKRRGKTKKGGDDELDDEEEGESDEDSEDDEDDSEDDDDDDSDDENDDEDDDDGDEEDINDEECDEDDNSENNDKDDDEDEDEESEDDEHGEPSAPSRLPRRTKQDREAIKIAKLDKIILTEGVNEAMPHDIRCPGSLDDFHDLIEQYVRSFDDLKALVQRILTWNSVHLPGKQGSDNKALLHNFMDMLLKYFIEVGDHLSSAASASQEAQDQILAELNFLAITLFKMSQDMPDVVAPLWGRVIKTMGAQLQKRLRDYAQGGKTSCWPSLGHILLFKLLGHVFAVTDFRHGIASGGTLFLCQCLSQCPVSSTRDLCSGLLIATVLMDFTAETHRLIPEIWQFCQSVIAACAPGLSTSLEFNGQKTFNVNMLGWLRQSISEFSCTGDVEKIHWEWFSSHEVGDILELDAQVASAVLQSVFSITSQLFNHHSTHTALPEQAAGIIHALKQLQPLQNPEIPRTIIVQHVNLLESANKACANILNSRQPLAWRKTVKVAIESKNPRFQLDYTFKKDKDPDQDRAQLKQLNRQFKREQKAAMRELRRDSEFLDNQRYQEKAAGQERRKADRNKNYAWMAEQQALINTEVRKNGVDALKGGGSGIGKKPRL